MSQAGQTMGMRKADSAAVGIPVLVLRAVCIVLGTTWLAHRLAVGLDGVTAPGPYVEALIDALQPDDRLADAAIRTLIHGLGALAVGGLLGAGLAALARRSALSGPIRVVLGLMTGPVLALTVPALALYPLARMIGGPDLVAVEGGPAPDLPLVPGADFFAFWIGGLGVALAPAATMLFSDDDREAGPFGLDVAGAPLAARPEPHRRWRIGFPTTILLLSLASVEAMTGLDGLFTTFFRAASTGDADRAMAVVVPVAVAGAALAVAVDLAGRRSATDGADVTTEPLGRGRAAAPLALAALALVAVAAIGSGLDTAASDSEPLLTPRAGGPWLGTDEDGRSLAERTAAALGPALLAAVVPALAATVIGSLVARARRVLPDRAGQALDALVDALWWPAPLLIPLAAWSGSSDGLPSLRASVLAITAGLLVPPASRLVGRSRSYRSSHRWAVRLRTASFLSAMALAAHLIVGFVGPPGAAERPTLGAMVSEGIPRYGESPWPTVVPLAAAALVALTFHWLASALARPAGPSRPRRSRAFTKSVAPPGPSGTTLTEPETGGGEPTEPEGPDADEPADADRLPVFDVAKAPLQLSTETGPSDGEAAGDNSRIGTAPPVEVEIEGAEIIDPERAGTGPDPFFAPDADQLEAEERLAAELASAGRIDLTEDLALDADDETWPEAAWVRGEDDGGIAQDRAGDGSEVGPGPQPDLAATTPDADAEEGVIDLPADAEPPPVNDVDEPDEEVEPAREDEPDEPVGENEPDEPVGENERDQPAREQEADEPAGEDEPDAEPFDATKTVELRPADLRRAGIRPPEDSPGLARADTDDQDPGPEA